MLTDGFSLAGEDAGEGIPVVGLHGLTATRRYLVMGSRSLERSGHRVVLYDARGDSPTRGQMNEFRIGTVRPGLIVIPPGVWHGVQNLHDGPSTLVNLVDRAYRYDDPDHWRLPPDTAEIPYRFPADRATSALW